METAAATSNQAQSARDQAIAVAKSAMAAQDRAEEAADFANEHLLGTRDYITRVLEPELEAARAEHARLSARIAQLEGYRQKLDG
jgi:hypothetical protein